MPLWRVTTIYKTDDKMAEPRFQMEHIGEARQRQGKWFREQTGSIGIGLHAIERS